MATTVLALLVAFGLDVDDDKQAAILSVVAVTAPIVVALWGRGRVWSPQSVARLIGRRPPKSAGWVDKGRGDKTIQQPGSQP